MYQGSDCKYSFRLLWQIQLYGGFVNNALIMIYCPREYFVLMHFSPDFRFFPQGPFSVSSHYASN